MKSLPNQRMNAMLSNGEYELGPKLPMKSRASHYISLTDDFFPQKSKEHHQQRASPANPISRQFPLVVVPRSSSVAKPTNKSPNNAAGILKISRPRKQIPSLQLFLYIHPKLFESDLDGAVGVVIHTTLF
jgi:hypothetical protein